MNLVQIFSNLLRKKASGDKDITPESFCPNCWGKQEYNGKFYNMVEKEKLI
jgi:hypothetical protein